MSLDLSGDDRRDPVSGPRHCGIHVRDHQSSDLIDGHCNTAPIEAPLLDVGGYLACGCHGTQREHTCTNND